MAYPQRGFDELVATGFLTYTLDSSAPGSFPLGSLRIYPIEAKKLTFELWRELGLSGDAALVSSFVTGDRKANAFVKSRKRRPNDVQPVLFA